MSEATSAAERATEVLQIVQGPEGSALYLNDTRIAGPKPWGGGQVTKTWETKSSDILAALSQRPDVERLERERDAAMEALRAAFLQRDGDVYYRTANNIPQDVPERIARKVRVALGTSDE